MFTKVGDGRFVLVAVPAGDEPLDARIELVRDLVAWDLVVADDVAELAPPTPEEIGTLRRWDPEGLFLRA